MGLVPWGLVHCWRKLVVVHPGSAGRWHRDQLSSTSRRLSGRAALHSVQSWSRGEGQSTYTTSFWIITTTLCRCSMQCYSQSWNSAHLMVLRRWLLRRRCCAHGASHSGKRTGSARTCAGMSCPWWSLRWGPSGILSPSPDAQSMIHDAVWPCIVHRDGHLFAEDPKHFLYIMQNGLE